MSFVDVRGKNTGRLLLRMDPFRDIIEICGSYWDREQGKRVRFTELIDLEEVRKNARERSGCSIERG